MKSKKLFARVLSVAFAIVAVLMIVVGITGYLAFGSSICANLTLNLPLYDGWVSVPLGIRLMHRTLVQSQLHDLNPYISCRYSEAAKVFLVLVLFCTYPIQFYVPIGILWPMIEEKIQSSNIYCELGFKAAMSALLCKYTMSNSSKRDGCR